MGTWIDFKELRKSLDFEKILDFYGVEIKRKEGDQHQGPCPLPTHKREVHKPSFSANLERGIWQCFGCKTSGNTLDFVCRMEGLSPSNSAAIRKTALLLQERYGESDDKGPRRATSKAESPAGETPPLKLPDRQVVVNAPLDFTLKNLDSHHPYFEGHGIQPQIVERFGLGFCNRGMLRGRIAIPLHDMEARLVGYAGLLVDPSTADEKNPVCLFPPTREKDGVLYEFRKEALLYNGHRIKGPVEELMVVQDVHMVWRLTQRQYPNVVSIFGNACGEDQLGQIMKWIMPEGHLWVFTDDDELGHRFAVSLLEYVAPYRWTRWVKLRENSPVNCTVPEMANFL